MVAVFSIWVHEADESRESRVEARLNGGDVFDASDRRKRHLVLSISYEGVRKRPVLGLLMQAFAPFGGTVVVAGTVRLQIVDHECYN